MRKELSYADVQQLHKVVFLQQWMEGIRWVEDYITNASVLVFDRLHELPTVIQSHLAIFSMIE
jgi:Rad3-related DNA helicase